MLSLYLLSLQLIPFLFSRTYMQVLGEEPSDDHSILLGTDHLDLESGSYLYMFNLCSLYMLLHVSLTFQITLGYYLRVEACNHRRLWWHRLLLTMRGCFTYLLFSHLLYYAATTRLCGLASIYSVCMIVFTLSINCRGCIPQIEAGTGAQKRPKNSQTTFQT